jgi:hypothetical protein
MPSVGCFLGVTPTPRCGRSALERSADEDQHSDSATMSAMFALMKTYGGLKRCLRHLTQSLLIVQDEKRQLQRDFDSEVERL